jgi:hypothetical protein
MMRAVLLMADQGIRQFIDLGTGIPTSPSVHELAQAVQPDARVLYVDNDPVVTAHSRVLLAKRENVEVLQADIREPSTILSSTELRRMIDFNEPVGVLFAAILHFVRNNERPADIIRAFTERMAVGSYLALSHITSDGTDRAVMATIRDAYAHASAPAILRSAEEISDFFSGFELQEPGLTDVTRWFPHSAVFAAHPPALKFLAGVGRRSMLSGSEASSCDALEELAAVLNPRDHVTTLVTGEGRQPRLTVGSRYAPLTKDVYVGRGSYWCGADEEVAPMSDPTAAARKVSKYLLMESRRIIRGH